MTNFQVRLLCKTRLVNLVKHMCFSSGASVIKFVDLLHRMLAVPTFQMPTWHKYCVILKKFRKEIFNYLLESKCGVLLFVILKFA